MPPKELIAASSRPLVLGILSRGESYGYAIIQQVQQVSGGHLDYTEGMLYPVLHRLERQGLIKSRWDKSRDGHPRKYYRVTREGSAALKSDRGEWVKVHNTLAALWGLKPVAG